MNTRAVAVLAACLWAWPAQATCDLEVAEFGGATGAVRRALTEDDLGTAARIVDDLERRYPCLTFAPARQAWAQWQFLVAVTRFAQGDRDQADLLARYAVSLDPLLDRSWLGSGHELRAVGARVPEGAPVQVRYPKPLRKRATLYVDGEPSAVGVPSDDLPHLVQLNDGVWWDSRFVERGAPHSARRLWVPRLAPPTVDVWADVGLRTHRQGGLFDSTDPDESFRRSPFWLGAVVLSGELKWRRALSAWGELNLGSGGDSRPDILSPSHAGVAIVVHDREASGQHLSVGAGLIHDRVPRGFVDSFARAFDSEERRFSLVHPMLLARFVRGRERRVDAYLGFQPYARLLGAGVRPNRGGLRYRVGFRYVYRFRPAFWDQYDAADESRDTLSERAWTVGVDLTMNLLDLRLNDDADAPRSRTGRNSRLAPRRR